MTPPSSDAAPAASQPSLPRVLLVDDEPAILDGLRRHLRRSFEVATAVGGVEALQLMETSEPFAAVLSDMRMPAMDGAAFLALVRQRHPDTVRMLLTGQSDMESTIAAINDGQIYRFLAKPCPGSTVEAALHDAVELHQQISAERDALRAMREGGRPQGGDAQAPAASTPLTLGDKLAAIRSTTRASQRLQ